jgi:hypothetical protein
VEPEYYAVFDEDVPEDFRFPGWGNFQQELKEINREFFADIPQDGFLAVCRRISITLFQPAFAK